MVIHANELHEELMRIAKQATALKDIHISEQEAANFADHLQRSAEKAVQRLGELPDLYHTVVKGA